MGCACWWGRGLLKIIARSSDCNGKWFWEGCSSSQSLYGPKGIRWPFGATFHGSWCSEQALIEREDGGWSEDLGWVWVSPFLNQRPLGQLRSTHRTSVSSPFVQRSYCFRAVWSITWNNVDRRNHVVNSKSTLSTGVSWVPALSSFPDETDAWTHGMRHCKTVVCTGGSFKSPTLSSACSFSLEKKTFLLKSQFMAHCLGLAFLGT